MFDDEIFNNDEFEDDLGILFNRPMNAMLNDN